MVDGQQADGGERTGRGPVTVGRGLGVVRETVGIRQEELGFLCCSLIDSVMGLLAHCEINVVVSTEFGTKLTKGRQYLIWK